jgi:hypothetical protein
MDEWARDLSQDVRRRHLLGQEPGGFNGAITLTSLVSDGDADDLDGGGGEDWVIQT